jgi:hypothetical protein
MPESATALILRLRQALLPKSFRISRESSRLAMPDALDALAGTGGASVEKDFAVSLSNQAFRIKRNLDALSGKDPDSREVRMMTRGLTGLLESMAEHGIQCVDPTGQVFDDGRLDFEVAGEPEVRPGIAAPEISYCEWPIVLLDGVLVQKGRGTVAKPEKV